MIHWILAALSISATARVEQTRLLTPAEAQGIRTWDVKYLAVKRNPATKSVQFTYSVSFKNETSFELAEVDLQVVMMRGGSTIYKTEPVALRSFTNVAFGITGSILPFDKTLSDFSVAFTVPAEFWAGRTSPDLRICGIKTFKGHLDLHNLAHLYSRMHSNPMSTLSLIKADPSLLDDKYVSGYSVSAAAWACSPPEVVKYVATHGGGWQVRMTNGVTNMHLAATNGYPGVLDLALAHGGNVNAKTAKSRRTPLYKAIRKGFPQNVEWLLKHGADPNAIDESGVPIAWWAIYDGQGQALKALVKHGANPHAWDRQGFGWMHYCTENVPFMPIVHSCGVGVDDSDPRKGFTPLMMAAINGQSAPAIWLLQHGADPNRKDRAGRTAFDYSRVSNSAHTDQYFRDLVRRYGHRSDSK